MNPEALFKLKKPCANCPFLKKGAIELADGRLESIIDRLVHDDHQVFPCHKTVHNERTGGDWDEDDNYTSSGEESACVGALIYLEKLHRPNIAMRLGQVCKIYHSDQQAHLSDQIIDPIAKG